MYIRGVAGKSLARPGRKQATATKLGIYSTFSPRSSIHFLTRCSDCCKSLKKFRSLSSQPGLRGSSDLRIGKMATFQLFFSVQRTGGSPTRPHPENRVGDQDTGSPSRPVSSSASPDLHEWWTQSAHVRYPDAQLLIYPKSGGLPRLAREFDQ